MVYIYDILILLTIGISLRSFSHRKKTITGLLMPSDRGLTNEKIKQMAEKYVDEKNLEKQPSAGKAGEMLSEVHKSTSSVNISLDMDDKVLREKLDEVHEKRIKLMI